MKQKSLYKKMVRETLNVSRLKIGMFLLLISLVLPMQVFADGYSPDILNNTGWFNQEEINPNRSRGVALYFFLLIIIVLTIFYGEHMKIPLIMFFASLMFFFFSYLVYTTISSIIGGILVIVSLFVFFRGVLMTSE